MEREAPEAGPCWYPPTLEEDLGRFIQDVHYMLFVEEFADVVAEGNTV